MADHPVDVFEGADIAWRAELVVCFGEDGAREARYLKRGRGAFEGEFETLGRLWLARDKARMAFESWFEDERRK